MGQRDRHCRSDRGGQKEDRRRTAEAGFNHHLVKPPDPKAVEGVLAQLKHPDVKQ